MQKKGRFHNVNLFYYLGVPPEVKLRIKFEAISTSGVALFAASLLVLCHVCRAPVASKVASSPNKHWQSPAQGFPLQSLTRQYGKERTLREFYGSSWLKTKVLLI